MENNANQLNPNLCKRNCGFFGNAACDGYCSKCYKDHVKRQNSGSAAGRVTPTTSAVPHTANETTSTTITHINTQMDTTSAQQSSTSPAVTFSLASTTTTTNAASAPIAIPQKQSANETVQPMVCESAPAFTSIEPATPTSVQQQMQEPQAEGMLKSVESTSSLTSNKSSSNDLSSSLNSEKKKRTRCCVDTCKRKVGLTGFDCRCGGLYCWEHRYSDKHECKFDYKELGQDQIRKNNPIIVGEKIQKI